MVYVNLVIFCVTCVRINDDDDDDDDECWKFTLTYTVCPEKNEPLNIFVLASEKLPWFEHS